MRDRQRIWQYAAYCCRRGLCWWILGLLLLPLLVQAEQFTGKVVGIRTGDTLSVLRNSRVVQVRLYGVACPGRQQAFGTQARQVTRDVAFRQTVAVVASSITGSAVLSTTRYPEGTVQCSRTARLRSRPGTGRRKTVHEGERRIPLTRTDIHARGPVSPWPISLTTPT